MKSFISTSNDTARESVSASPGWLTTDEGARILRERANKAAQAFLESDLTGRLQRELEASRAGGSKIFRIGNSLRVLTEELALLAFAHAHGVVPPESEKVWPVVTRDFLPVLFGLDEINFQGRGHTPPWHSDLWTADIGANLAWAIRFPTPLGPNVRPIEELIRTKCLAPILADWLDDRTRWHSLDSMGHNWWSVIVSSAGVMAALMGHDSEADRIAGKLIEWFHFAGRDFSHKRPNFGPEGDYVEGFLYCEYALSNVCVLAHLRRNFKWVPDGLTPPQARGLADWFKRSYLRTHEGWRIQRFGDISPRHRPRAEVWHALAVATEDDSLLALAHEIKSQPHSLPEFLLWTPRTSSHEAFGIEPSLRVFPTSGMIFDFGPTLAITVRAGECWVHNHLDAGTFVFQQNGIVWIDDAGTCAYSHADYLDYYVTPGAHNVALAPALCPSPRRAVYEGLPATGRILSAARHEALSISCVETGILSGSALARSYRWFLRLGGDGIIVWDDLAAYAPQSFECSLNITTDVQPMPVGGSVRLCTGTQYCNLTVFSDARTEFAMTPVVRGEPELREPSQSISRMNWRSAPVERVKFGTALGTSFKSAVWRGSSDAGGWQCTIETDRGDIWRVWFNPLADGRTMHQNCVSNWEDFQTDAYALIIHENAGLRFFSALEASFVRRGGEVLFSNLSRQSDACLRPF
jgi:hypothetical protein